MRTCFISLLALIGSLAAAQTQPASRPAATFRMPTLLVKEGANQSPLKLAKADIRVVINGFIAETTETVTFRNDTPRALEGELSFPLPEGAAVCGYGLDVNGVMVDGVPVEREKARIAYETEVRRGVDPGIIEHVSGNNYRTRIYPIPANGTRTVKVVYVSEVAGDGQKASYALPLAWGQAVDQMNVRVEVVRPANGPTPKAGEGLEFKQQEDRFIAEKSFANLEFKSDLLIDLPQGQGPTVMVEKRTRWSQSIENIEEEARTKHAAELRKEEYYFAAQGGWVPPPKMPMPQAKPLRIGIAWDASLSRSEVDKTRELAILDRYLKGLVDIELDVVVFRNTADAPVILGVHKGDTKAVLDFLLHVTYDGATNLGTLVLPKSYHGFFPNRPIDERVPDYSYWLLFTDGNGNIGGDVPARVERPVFVINGDARANHALLRQIAQSSGGDYLNLAKLTEQEAAARIGRQPISLLSVEFKPEEVADVYPRSAQPLDNYRVVVTGRLLAPEATITLKFGGGGYDGGSQTITLKRSDSADTGIVARLWAQQKLADLAVLPEKNGDEMLKLGRQFNLVTPNSSLMVLETVDQYVRYRLVPPQNRPDVYKEFIARIEKQETEKVAQQRAKIDQVLAWWNDRVKWWETEYKYPADFKYKELAAATQPATGPASLVSAGRDGAYATAADVPAPVALPEGGDGGMAWHNPGGGHPTAVKPLKDGKDDPEPALSITIKPWDPNTPYLKALKAAPADKAYDVYLEQRKSYAASPAFYLDCADFFLKSGQQDLGIRILTNVIELQLDSAPLLRIAAHRLNQIGQRDVAIELFEKVLRIRPEEPQSYRDLALALADRADALIATMPPAQPMEVVRLIVADYNRAISLLHQVVMSNWDRFPEIETIALEEANRLLYRVKLSGMSNPFDPRLVKNLDVDVRIVLTWDADLTDVDLWVTEPSGEKVFYSHNRSTIGGLVSKDFTQGYGPEEYVLRRAMPGVYKIQCNFYGSTQQTLAGPTTVQATVITNFGRPDEKREHLTLRLAEKKETVDIGEVKLEARNRKPE